MIELHSELLCIPEDDLPSTLKSAFPECYNYYGLLDMAPSLTIEENSPTGTRNYLVRHFSSEGFDLRCPQTLALLSGAQAQIFTVLSTVHDQIEYPVGAATGKIIRGPKPTVVLHTAQGVSYPKVSPAHSMFPKNGIRLFAKQFANQLLQAGIEELLFKDIEQYVNKERYYTRDPLPGEADWILMRDPKQIEQTKEHIRRQYERLFAYFGATKVEHGLVSKLR